MEEYDRDTRKWAMLCHIAGLAGFIIPFAGLVAPLVIWLLKKEEHPFIDEQGKEAVNFQISMAICMFVSGLLTLVLIGWLLLLPLVLFDIVMCIIAGMKANDGVAYRYPVAIRLIK
jgi:uncharacterized protein